MTSGETSMQQQQINTASPLVFLFQKKLSKTDVCPKRKEILLPYRAARKELPSLTAPFYCITLPMRDLKTGQIWRFKYKFWFRRTGSYLLGYTGHFLDQHKLEVGDTIKLYKDRQDNQFVIEAVKLGRPPATVARRGRTEPARRLSTTSEALPHGFV